MNSQCKCLLYGGRYVYVRQSDKKFRDVGRQWGVVLLATVIIVFICALILQPASLNKAHAIWIDGEEQFYVYDCVQKHSYVGHVMCLTSAFSSLTSFT